MRHGYVPAQYTIFKGIHKLRPGHLPMLEEGAREPRIEAYWSAYSAAEQGRLRPFAGTREDAVDKLDALMHQSLRGQMMADVPLGAFLSGGIDSSTVVALMQSMSAQPIRTFTIGFDVAGYNEAEHAKKVAEHLGTHHTVRGSWDAARSAFPGASTRPGQARVRDAGICLRRGGRYPVGSPTFGRHVSAVISAENWTQMWVPARFAHGYCTLEPNTEVIYKVTDYYAPDCDRGLRWDDADLGIKWPVDPDAARLSDKDRKQPALKELAPAFVF